MKKVVYFVFLILLITEFSLRLFGNFYFVKKDEISNLTPLLVCYGDSVTYGSTEKNSDYPYFLSEKIKKYKVINRATPSANTANIYDFMIEDFKNKNVKIALIMAGGANLYNFEKSKYESRKSFLDNFEIYKLYKLVKLRFFKKSDETFDFSRMKGDAYLSFDYFKYVFSGEKGWEFIKKGENEKAVKYYEKLKNRNKIQNVGYAVALLNLGKINEAIRVFKTFKYKEKTFYYGALAYVNIEIKNFEKAEELLKKGVSIGKKDVFLINMCGYYFYKKRNYEKAKKIFSYSLKNYDKFGETYYYLGVIEKERGNYEKAKEYFEEGIKNDPKYLDNYTELCYLFMKFKEFEKAREICDKLLKKNPYFFDGIVAEQILKISTDDGIKNYSKIEEKLKELEKKYPENDKIKENLARLYLKERKIKEAVKYYEKAGDKNVAEDIEKGKKTSEIIKEIKKDLKKIKMLCEKNEVIPVFLNYPTYDNVAMKSFAEKNNVLFFDLYKQFEKYRDNTEYVGNDKFHLTKKGNEILAGIIYENLIKSGVLNEKNN